MTSYGFVIWNHYSRFKQQILIKLKSDTLPTTEVDK